MSRVIIAGGIYKGSVVKHGKHSNGQCGELATGMCSIPNDDVEISDESVHASQLWGPKSR